MQMQMQMQKKEQEMKKRKEPNRRKGNIIKEKTKTLKTQICG
jgi:hypothetical protein